MSAFICNPDHITALAVFAVTGRYGDEAISADRLNYWLGEFHCNDYADAELDSKQDRAQVIADILHAENVRSVSYRYRESPAYDDDGISTDKLPGLIKRPERIAIDSRDVFNPPVRDPVWILKMCRCLSYQSCETEDWESTLAYRVLQAIEVHAVYKLPGMDDAPWEFTRPQAAA